MTGTRVSVALCTHNGEQYVGEQIATIAAQTRPVAEVVLSDDASADATVEVAGERLRSAGPATPATLVLLENPAPLGVTANFEQALSRTSGDLIALSDQDDVWHPDKIERLVEVLGSSGALLVWTDARIVGNRGEPLGRTLFEDLEISARERELVGAGRAFPALLRRNLATGATVLLRRDLLAAALPIPAEWVHDEWLAIIASAVGDVAMLDETTIDYRLHDRNQIGVTAPSLRNKIRRVLQPRGDRNELLAAKFAVLAERLRALGDRVPTAYAAAAEQKARFEGARARLSARRWRRIPVVVSLLRSGDYDRYASQGRRDVLRDLLQPHGSGLR